VLSDSGTIWTRFEDRRTHNEEMRSREASLDLLNATEQVEGVLFVERRPEENLSPDVVGRETPHSSVRLGWPFGS
jgi:hypothetical protein